MLLLILTAALWSLNGPLIKLLQQGPLVVSGLAIAFYRSLFAGLTLTPLALPQLRTLRRGRPLVLLGAIVAFTTLTVTFVIATTRTEAANAIILQYTSTLWVCLLSPFVLGERARRRDLAMLTAAVIGIGVIFAGQFSTDLPALCIGLLSGVAFGMTTMLLRLLRACAPAAVAWMNNLGSALLLAPAMIVWGSFALDGRALLLLALMGAVQFGIPYYLYSWGLRKVQAYQAALVTLLEPVLNPVWTYLAVGEAPRHTTIGGGLLILGSLVAYIISTTRRPRNASPPA